MKASPSIVIAHASVGSGHRVAAESIGAQLRARAQGEFEVTILDALEFGALNISGDTLTTSYDGPQAVIYDRAWSSIALGAVMRDTGAPLFSAMYHDLLERLRETEPAVIVCTHALPAMIAARAVDRGTLDSHVVLAATDFGVHGMWPQRGVSLFCAPGPTAEQELLERGYARDQVVMTGIPVRPDFSREFDRPAVRAAHGFAPTDTVVVAVAGSSLPGPYRRFKDTLADALPDLASRVGVRVVVATGSDHEYAREVSTLADAFGLTNVQVIGYTEEMAELMVAADLVLAKPGGLVCAESLAVGAPLVLAGPAVGQERANADLLSAREIARYVEHPHQLGGVVGDLLDHPEVLESMRRGVDARFGRTAAADIAARVLNLAAGR